VSPREIATIVRFYCLRRFPVNTDSLSPVTGKDYVYRKAAKGFKICSLGENLKDNGGKWVANKEGKRDWKK